jgi:2-C-methyl-D-erythritol 2,4-cyclodiphosphate synthase
MTQKIETLRIGQGYDIHALVPGRKLLIGGVDIAFDRGLLGHSDGDVLLHAICDALLGAAGLGDIGGRFPDTDPALSGADSGPLLATVGREVAQRGYRVVNIDTTIIAQAPRMAPHIPTMVTNVARLLGIDRTQVNIKAKTNERLGFLGRGEGIAAQAIALIEAAAAG